MPHGNFEQIDYLETVIKNALYFHVAFSVDDQPYVVPLNFGYHDGIFYVHSKPGGKKLDMLAKNPKIAFSLQTNVEPLHDAEEAENCTMRYMSVMGDGTAQRVESLEEKKTALDVICKQYDLTPYDYSEKMLATIAIIKIIPDTMTGKWGNVDCDQYFQENI